MTSVLLVRAVGGVTGFPGSLRLSGTSVSTGPGRFLDKDRPEPHAAMTSREYTALVDGRSSLLPLGNPKLVGGEQRTTRNVGGPSPASLTACVALPPRPSVLRPPSTHPRRPPTCPIPGARRVRPKPNVLHVGVERVGKDSACPLSNAYSMMCVSLKHIKSIIELEVLSLSVRSHFQAKSLKGVPRSCGYAI